MSAVQSIDAPEYTDSRRPDDEAALIASALAILAARVKAGPAMTAPSTVRQYLTLHAAKHTSREVFGVLFLDAQHKLIEHRELFMGTLTQASVYPREVVKAALELNAAAVILTHNHPSGVPEPSRADENLTRVLKDALALVDVRVLDHVITAGGDSLSMVERGLI